MNTVVLSHFSSLLESESAESAELARLTPSMSPFRRASSSCRLVLLCALLLLRSLPDELISGSLVTRRYLNWSAMVSGVLSGVAETVGPHIFVLRLLGLLAEHADRQKERLHDD